MPRPRKAPPASRSARACGHPPADLPLRPEVGVLAQAGALLHGGHQVEQLGPGVFAPVTMEVTHRAGANVPAWFLDTAYNGRVFHVTPAFFPRTGAWERLKKALKGDYDEAVWDHLTGTVSAPFAGGGHRQTAVKVIDARGNELLVVRKLEGET